MHPPFQEQKATEVASLFLKQEGGEINLMKLVKLIYLTDRISLDKRGIPIVGGRYLSMKNGPVTSEVLDLINSGSLGGEQEGWAQCISDRQDHEVALASDPGLNNLSSSEIAIVEGVYHEHGDKDQWQLRDWCHEHLPEWTKIDSGRVDITVKRLCDSLGKSKSETDQILEDAREADSLSHVFA